MTRRMKTHASRRWHGTGMLWRPIGSSPADAKADFGNASILKDGRVIFNIAGNKYRLVVWINVCIPRGLYPVHWHSRPV